MHQEQAVEYIEVTLDDIAVANRLACEVLGRSADELPPQTRRLLGLVDEMVTAACRQKGIDRADCRFSRRNVREFTNWGNTQLKIHLKRLQELEYLLFTVAAVGNRSSTNCFTSRRPMAKTSSLPG